MGERRTATHETHLTVRLLGPHEVTWRIANGELEVMMPGAVINVTDRKALSGVYGAWVEAGVIALNVFTGDRRAVRQYVSRVPQRILGVVKISGRQPHPTIAGKAPEISPSGCGQLVIRLGHLTIVCDDRTAWESQDAGWRAACESAAEAWGGPQLTLAAFRGEQRAKRRYE
ncbi:hypothetical protein [Actinoallomurus sp. CA-142502]|uniref:hypothetical protein n=1 Tax=Actinoallomurus sp. CA-142502 TaxID=3239885 RepID=UPI003D8F51D3